MQERILGRKGGRVDDNIETIKKRFDLYNDITMKIIKNFEGRGLMRKVNGEGSMEEVFGQITTIFYHQGHFFLTY